MKLGVVLASRGTMFSRTMESVFENTKGHNWKLYMAHGLPIPDCFNVPLKKALKDKCDWIWFVEEDMYIPKGTLKRMFELKQPIVTVDYGDKKSGKALILRDIDDGVVFSGMGCLLVKADVFEKLSEPYFRPMVFWQVVEDNGDIRWEPHPEIKETGYGQQDIYFCWIVNKLGYKITELPKARIGHQRLVSKGGDSQNGVDTVEIVYINNENP
jgi:hypothetical protein